MAKQMLRVTISLMVATALRPLYGKDQAAEARVWDLRLESIGWQVNPNGELISVAEAARHLGQAESTTRRLIGVKGAGGSCYHDDLQSVSPTLGRVRDDRSVTTGQTDP
jgi:hypothetical protein